MRQMECRPRAANSAADVPPETIGFVARGGEGGRCNVQFAPCRLNLVFGGCTVAKKSKAKKATKKPAKKAGKKKK